MDFSPSHPRYWTRGKHSSGGGARTGLDQIMEHQQFTIDRDVWEDSPILIGKTKLEPRSDVKNIMVTGGAGFIASWLVRHLTLTYPNAYNLVRFDKIDYCSSLNNVRSLKDRSNFSFYLGDLTNAADVADCLDHYHIDTIFHLAAQSHVDLSFENSLSFTYNNEVYGGIDSEDADLPESSVLAPTNPYAASKAAAEMIIYSCQCSFKLPIIVVRSNNIF